MESVGLTDLLPRPPVGRTSPVLVAQPLALVHPQSSPGLEKRWDTGVFSCHWRNDPRVAAAPQHGAKPQHLEMPHTTGQDLHSGRSLPAREGSAHGPLPPQPPHELLRAETTGGAGLAVWQPLCSPPARLNQPISPPEAPCAGRSRCPEKEMLHPVV